MIENGKYLKNHFHVMCFKGVTDSLNFFLHLLSTFPFSVCSEGFGSLEDSCFPSFFIPLMFSFCCLVAESEREDETNVEDGKPESLHVHMVCFLKKYIYIL